MFPINFRLSSDEDGTQAISVFDGTDVVSAADDHPNFEQIKALCLDSLNGEAVELEDITSLFDVAQAVAAYFEPLSDRVSVRGGQVFFDNDPVSGPLEEQIVAFLEAGEDFEPLVNLYENLASNPLGDVREGLFAWIVGQKKEGNFTITRKGNIVGYKSVRAAAPEWRENEQQPVYVPSRRGAGIVNGIEVGPQQFIEQVVGDVVEMPRSKVLHAPSQACGDGLHIGTYAYAKSFTGDTVLAVEFSPRDIVSLPDSNSDWKLRVCRYEVLEAVDEPYDEALFGRVEDSLFAPDEAPEPEVPVTDARITVGDRVRVTEAYKHDGALGKTGVVKAIDALAWPIGVEMDDPEAARVGLWRFDAHELEKITEPEDLDLSVGDTVEDVDGDVGVITEVLEDGEVTVDYYGNTNTAEGFSAPFTSTCDQDADSLKRIHGKGGPTSQEAKGRGKHPAQDSLGRFSGGRPGSQRDSSTGRFA